MALNRYNYIDEEQLDDYSYSPIDGGDFAPVLSHAEAAEEDRILRGLSPLYNIPDQLDALRSHTVRSEKKTALSVVQELQEAKRSCESASESQSARIDELRSIEGALGQVAAVLHTIGDLSSGSKETSIAPPPDRELEHTSASIPEPPVYDKDLLMQAVNLLESSLDEVRRTSRDVSTRVASLREIASAADLITLHCSIEAAKLDNDAAREFSTGVVARLNDLSHRLNDTMEQSQTNLQLLEQRMTELSSSIMVLQSAENEAARYSDLVSESVAARDAAIAERDSLIAEYDAYGRLVQNSMSAADKSLRTIGDRGGRIHSVVDSCRAGVQRLAGELEDSLLDYKKIQGDLRAAGQVLKDSGASSRFQTMDQTIRSIKSTIAKVIDSFR